MSDSTRLRAAYRATQSPASGCLRYPGIALRESGELQRIGVDWVRKGAAAVAHLNPLDPTMSDMVNNFLANGGNILVCPPCAKVRGYDEDSLIEGATGAAALSF